MNHAGMVKDGIANVDNNGTVHFGEGPRQVLEEVLDLHGWKTMKVDECTTMMGDLITAYQKLADKQNK